MIPVTIVSSLISATSEGPSTMTVITAMVALAVGSGGGGLLGALVMWKRFRVEQTQAETKNKVDLQSVDVDQFRALFPGGLGEAVEHWRDEARSLYVEVDELRDQHGKDHEDIVNLRSDLRVTNRKLEATKKELDRAKVRIAQLESERDNP